MTELVLHEPQTALREQMDYARAVATGSLLPQAYRDNPANVLIAVGLGAAMGLTPAESLYRIDVISGKPCAAAELIAANVRKAGHKLRVRGDDQGATASIWRSDDPEFEFTVTRDVKWAQQMGLATKDNYKKQPGTMLQWRAITAVARLACPEALYGVAYVAEEMDDLPGARYSATVEQPKTGRERMRDLVDAQPTEPTDLGDASEAITTQQLRLLHKMMKEAGLETSEDRHAFQAETVGHPVASTNDLTKAEAGACIDALAAASGELALEATA